MKYELIAIEERPYKPWREHDLVEVFAVIRRHGEGREIVFSDVFKREEWRKREMSLRVDALNASISDLGRQSREGI